MTLAEYIDQTGETHEQLATKIGECSVSGLRKWLRGERIPQKEVMERIFVATDGKVRPDDFYDIPKEGVPA